MEYYFAPMEGITGWIYRKAHHRFFGGVDKYFTPFLSPGASRCFTSREMKEIDPEHNRGMKVVPQLLTRSSQDFIWAARELKEMGYEEVNFNLGCPSGTVTAKGKGSGFLAYPQELLEFLDDIFQQTDIRISVKTRIGKEDPKEFVNLLKIYNQFPISRLIIHPRVRREFYKGKPHLDVFAWALEESRNPVCYNGDLFTSQEISRFSGQFSQVESVMMGRGLIANPFLAGMQRKDKEKEHDLGEEQRKEVLYGFLQELLTGYLETMSGERNVLFKLKELWAYLIFLFADGEKYGKKIRKAQSIEEYRIWVERLFAEKTLSAESAFRG